MNVEELNMPYEVKHEETKARLARQQSCSARALVEINEEGWPRVVLCVAGVRILMTMEEADYAAQELARAVARAKEEASCRGEILADADALFANPAERMAAYPIIKSEFKP